MSLGLPLALALALSLALAFPYFLSPSLHSVREKVRFSAFSIFETTACLFCQLMVINLVLSPELSLSSNIRHSRSADGPRLERHSERRGRDLTYCAFYREPAFQKLVFEIETFTEVYR